MPESYRSPHTGTIADLIRQQGMSGANRARMIGGLQGQQIAASGQAWGNAISNIAQGVTGTLRDFAQQREQAPMMELRAKQAEQLGAELSAMETAQAQKRIGELAQMVKASGYDPATAEPVFRAIGRLSPDYEQPLMQSLMEPSMLRQVTDTLISQVPGYKAPEGFSLSEGQTRFSPEGTPIANVPKPEPVQPSFTLGEGQQRFAPDGSVIAAGPPRPAPTASLQRAEVLLDGKPTMAVFNPQSGAFSVNGQDVTARVKPIPPQGPVGGEPLESVIGPDGQPVLTPRSQARGMRPATTREQPTEDERKSSGWLKQIEGAIATMDELEDSLTEAELYQIQSLPQEQLIGLINRNKLSENAKRYFQAFEEFTEARLRSVSGATITPQEEARDRRIYAKQYGETPELATQRRGSRDRAREALRSRAGRALPKDDGKAKDNDPLGIRK